MTPEKKTKARWKKGDAVQVRSGFDGSIIGVGTVLYKQKLNWESEQYGEPVYRVQIGPLESGYRESLLS